MSKSYIPRVLRQKVADQAHHRCGYCLTAQDKTRNGMSIEHLLPEMLGGLTEEENLWLACADCNSFKGDLIAAPDPFTDVMVALFNPRQQVWQEHFAWMEDGTLILGRTATGRATIEALKLNRPNLIKSRKRWASGGWKPPQD